MFLKVDDEFIVNTDKITKIVKMDKKSWEIYTTSISFYAKDSFKKELTNKDLKRTENKIICLDSHLYINIKNVSVFRKIWSGYNDEKDNNLFKFQIWMDNLDSYITTSVITDIDYFLKTIGI